LHNVIPLAFADGCSKQPDGGGVLRANTDLPV